MKNISNVSVYKHCEEIHNQFVKGVHKKRFLACHKKVNKYIISSCRNNKNFKLLSAVEKRILAEKIRIFVMTKGLCLGVTVIRDSRTGEEFKICNMATMAKPI